MQMADDQLAEDNSVRALLRNYYEARPLIVLIDDKYELFPYDLRAKNVTYAVLGYYIITNAWGVYFVFCYLRSNALVNFPIL